MFTPKYSARDRQPGQSNAPEAASTSLPRSSGVAGGHSIPENREERERGHAALTSHLPCGKCPQCVKLSVTFQHAAQRLTDAARGRRFTGQSGFDPKVGMSRHHGGAHPHACLKTSLLS